MGSDAFGRGVYGVGQAARLSGIPPQSLRRWLVGYGYAVGSAQRALGPVCSHDYGTIDGRLVLSFLDLQQARAIANLRHPVRGESLSLQGIRRWVAAASEKWKTPYPLAHADLMHDGHRIWAVVGKGEHPHLLDVFTDQTAMKDVLQPFLRAVHFGPDSLVETWWPGSQWADVGQAVIADPNYRFGRPVAAVSKVETKLLAASAAVNGSIETVASWYEVPIEDVRASVAFEARLARRAAA